MVVAVVATMGLLIVPMRADSATISVDPGTAPPGATVTASGSGYFYGGPASACEIRIDDDANLHPDQQGGDPTPAEVVGTCTVSQTTGAATGTFMVPNWSPGAYQVAICNLCNAEFPEIAQTGFNLSSPPSTTTTVPSTTSTSAPAGTTTTSPPTTTSPTEPTSSTTTTLPIADIDFTPAGPSRFPLGTPSALHVGLGVDLGLDISFAPRCGVPESALVVDFDDQPLGSWSGATSDLDEMGVSTMFGPNSAVWPDPLIATNSLGTASGDRGVMFNTEFGDPFIIFDEPVRYVGLYVGLPLGAETDVVVSFSTSRTAEGSTDYGDTVTLSLQPSPSTNCLLIDPPGDDTIELVVLRLSTTEGRGFDDPPVVLMDRVFFGRDGDHPEVSDDPIEAQIAITSPWPESSIRDDDDLTVTANIIFPDVPGGSPVPRDERLIYPSAGDGGIVFGWMGVRRVASPPGLVRYQATASNVELPLGRQPLVAIMTGDYYARDGIFVQVDSGLSIDRIERTPPFDIEPLSLEVTQGVRREIPVSAGGATVAEDHDFIADRTTHVRAYASLERLGSDPWNPIPFEARLYGFRGATMLEGSPIAPTNPERTVGESGHRGDFLRAMRGDASASWNFELPRSWTQETSGGPPLKLIFDVNPPGHPLHIPEAEGMGGDANRLILDNIDFVEIQPRIFHFFLVDYLWSQPEEEEPRRPGELVECDEGICQYRLQADFSDMVEAVRGMRTFIPIPDRTRIVIRHTQIVEPIDLPEGTVPWDREDYYPPLRELYGDDLPPMFAPMLFSAQLGCGGEANLNRPVFNTGAGGVVVAHEAIHSLGISHVSTAHGELEGGGGLDRYEGDHGEFGGRNPADVVGWDIIARQPFTARTAGGHAHALMSYGSPPEWVDPTTWEAAAASMIATDGSSDAITVAGPWFQETFHVGHDSEVAIGQSQLPSDLRLDRPVAGIVSPADGAVVRPWGSIDLMGVAFEKDGTEVEPHDMVWTLNGEEVARGTQWPTLVITEGQHALSLETPAGTHSITIYGSADQDSDSLPDILEVAAGLDPAIPDDPHADDDDDRLFVWEELRYGTSVTSADTDGDTYADWVEVRGGTDPTDPESIPVSMMHWPEDEPLPQVEGEPEPAEESPLKPVADEESAGPGEFEIWPALVGGLALLIVSVGLWLYRRSESS